MTERAQKHRVAPASGNVVERSETKLELRTPPPAPTILDTCYDGPPPG